MVFVLAVVVYWCWEWWGICAMCSGVLELGVVGYLCYV